VAFKAIGSGFVGTALAVALAGCGTVSGLETRARILAQPSCSDFFFPIYFADRSPVVGPPAERVMADAGRRSKDCRIEEVKVVGLPDPGGSEPQLELSRERARRVAGALTAAGFPAPAFQMSPLGEAGDSLPDARLPRRRVDVYVRFGR